MPTAAQVASKRPHRDVTCRFMNIGERGSSSKLSVTVTNQAHVAGRPSSSNDACRHAFSGHTQCGLLVDYVNLCKRMCLAARRSRRNRVAHYSIRARSYQPKLSLQETNTFAN